MQPLQHNKIPPSSPVESDPKEFYADAITTLRENMGSDIEVARLIAIFVEQGDRDQQAMQAAWPEALEKMSHLAHRLKGSSLSLGAESLVHISRQLEHRARAGVADAETYALLCEVETEYQRVRQSLQVLIAKLSGRDSA